MLKELNGEIIKVLEKAKRAHLGWNIAANYTSQSKNYGVELIRDVVQLSPMI